MTRQVVYTHSPSGGELRVTSLVHLGGELHARGRRTGPWTPEGKPGAVTLLPMRYLLGEKTFDGGQWTYVRTEKR